MKKEYVKQPWGWYEKRKNRFFDKDAITVVPTLFRYAPTKGLLEVESLPPNYTWRLDMQGQFSHLDRYLSGHKGFIAGGYFKSKFLGLPVKDIDIFFESQEDYDQALLLYGSKEGFKCTYASRHSSVFTERATGIKVDLVRYFNTPANTIRDFDFTVNKFAYIGSSIIFHVDFYLHLDARILIVDESCRNPERSILRCARYGEKYGFNTPKATMRKLLQMIDSGVILEDSEEY